jgi:hypothetical protein
MIHAHGDDVVRIPFQIRRQIVFKTDETEWPRADELAVDPNLGVVIDPVEFNRDQLVFLRRVEPKMFAIPANPAGYEAVAAAIVRAERTIADARSLLLKSQFASKSSVRRAGEAGE